MIALLLALLLGSSVTTAEGCAVLPEAERAPCAQTVAGGYTFTSSVGARPAVEVADTSLAGMSPFEQSMVREAKSQSKSLQTIAVVQVVSLVIGLLGIIAAFTA
jgi:hypothetical protein